MKTDDTEYYYEAQMKKLLVQFLAVFVGFKVKSGATNELGERFVDVQVKNGSSDRVVASILNDNTQNKVTRLPLIAGTFTNIEMDPSLRHGSRTERSTTYFPSGGKFPTDLKTVTQQMPVPYQAQFELNIFVSSQEQHYELLEQILVLFDPTLELWTSDEPFDWCRLRSLELMNVQFDESIPGVDRRIIQTTLSFRAPVYLSLPNKVRKNHIATIKMRVGAVNQFYPIEDALSQLDQDGIEYDTIAKLGDLSLD